MTRPRVSKLWLMLPKIASKERNKRWKQRIISTDAAQNLQPISPNWRTYKFHIHPNAGQQVSVRLGFDFYLWRSCTCFSGALVHSTRTANTLWTSEIHLEVNNKKTKRKLYKKWHIHQQEVSTAHSSMHTQLRTQASAAENCIQLDAPGEARQTESTWQCTV